MIYPLIACTLVLALFAPAPMGEAALAPVPEVRAQDTALPGASFISIDGWTMFVMLGDELYPVGPFKDMDPLDAPAPGVAEVSYVDGKGNVVKVIIPCSNYQTEDACWAAAKKSLAAAEKHFPKPVPAKKD